MSLTQARKQELINQHQIHGTDTGSTDVQIATLTEKINRLSAHLKINKNDHSSRHGLLNMIGRRKALLAYLQAHHPDRYRSLIAQLGIRG